MIHAAECGHPPSYKYPLISQHVTSNILLTAPLSRLLPAFSVSLSISRGGPECAAAPSLLQMSKQLPPHRLADVLKRNSPARLKRHAAELGALQAALPPSTWKSRFSQNKALVSPKALRLLVYPQVLQETGLFAIYKPPFCPMKRTEANANYHRVSLESFLSAALSSRDVYPHIRHLSREGTRVRVLNTLATEASGPVVVSVSARDSDKPLAFQPKKEYHPALHYQLLVAGHLPVEKDATVMLTNSASVLYPSIAEPEPSFQYRVSQNGYYAHHPVSLVEVRIPCSLGCLPAPPLLSHFTAHCLDTYVIGEDGASKSSSGDEASMTAKRPAAAALRGDRDFPRVFCHLEQAVMEEVSPSPDSGASRNEEEEEIVFHCRNAFEPVIQAEKVYGLKGISINIHDGGWTPMSELL